MPEPGPGAPDPARLAALHAASFTTPRPWDAAEIAGLLASAPVFVLEEAGGFLIGRAIAGEAELLTLAVAPARRRQGLGRRLVEGFLTRARALQAETAFLEVSAENPAAIALYESLGFRRAGVRRGYYAAPDGQRIDAIVMTRTLAPPP
ncbi:ribosomal protein S18-alanine N-acetyltransferase [Pseudogemmobacter sonorensis]|uniref:ribosomal protein S18-alanine N-acetyltransferase n=1 Tax=Pseudogemmobacter sonorensis TaxID=2989681 RepID=UPI0036CA2F0B